MGKIRIATPADAPAIQAIYAPMVSDTVISFELIPPTIEEMAGRIEAILATYPYLVAELDGAVVGYAYASQHRAREAYRWSVDVTVYIDPAAHRRGIGRALYQRLLPILEQQGFHAAYAGIAQPNAASVGLHEALGFTHIGTYPEVGFKHGQWHGVGYWRKPLNTVTPPREIVAFSEARGYVEL
ncbi:MULTISPECIES: arsinothricin resistance N-acetyltransferase ArsN1 family B [Pseudomonas]|uniref:arsinothricin resistance N-acetyltransferase ArsN1 family B n=1 Tax=Pseudomonas TaxID=286 RepID=UPI0005A75707|nr:MULTISPECIES: arsinothricin resistance N-acetyltransferase ArsN1 family B [Pseudomonas]AZD91615.1 Acetyltransferase, GNAT family [Pseudomonas chlororaphis subsp. aureofaciens]KAB0530534.1 N-acetyltransferase family protein [Pseudomonas chlororaphis subsp. aureofaciens]TSD31947.1 N-acetyltransferase [Pseudomonas sp. ATCC 13985]WDG62968.1 GNAT family N-acetyltransferase [Pseudomonas chlororaphis]WDG68780.1 GNAT family N-acetyltransferase [Pseudomonas chlororaphis]